jgi:murein DD-endopeptidase MepM/ murein hydrolase activator NlpD
VFPAPCSSYDLLVKCARWGIGRHNSTTTEWSLKMSSGRPHRNFLQLAVAVGALCYPNLAMACSIQRDAAPVAMDSDVHPKFAWPVRGPIVVGCESTSNAIDIAAPKGTVVKAAADGIVLYAGNELKGYGVLVLISHGNGWTTAYAYNSEALVKRGDQVRQGQSIARLGDVAFSPELHFEIARRGKSVNPRGYLPRR